MSLRRVIDWELRLAAYLAVSGMTRFEWGVHDCCRFACGGLVAQGLPDPMASVRAYSSERGAAAALRRLGGTLEAAAAVLSAEAGLVPVAPAFAGRGMVVLAEIESDGGAIAPALGLVGLDGRQALFAGDAGLVTRRLKDCRLAWGIS